MAKCYNVSIEDLFMKVFVFIVLCAFVSTLCLSACGVKQDAPMIKSKRRFEKYMEPLEKQNENVVDLSDGPRLRYEANFGPKNPSFDFKIVNPY